MRRPIVALVIGLSVGSSTAALGRTLAPGCLPDSFQGLRDVSVRFGGMAASEGVARFYEHLRVRGALPCRRVVLDEAQPTLSHALMAAEHRATPPPYPATMDTLICRLNARNCSKGRPTGTTFVVPDLHLETHFPVWTNLPLDPDEDPDKDLEGVFARHHYSLPEKVDQDEWRDKIRKANFGFERWVTRGVQSKKHKSGAPEAAAVAGTDHGVSGHRLAAGVTRGDAREGVWYPGFLPRLLHAVAAVRAHERHRNRGTARGALRQSAGHDLDATDLATRRRRPGNHLDRGPWHRRRVPVPASRSGRTGGHTCRRDDRRLRLQR